MEPQLGNNINQNQPSLPSTAIPRRNSTSPSNSVMIHDTHDFDSTRKPDSTRKFLMGYVLASVASSLLTTIFVMFHVDVFLRIYQLPLDAYARGNVVYSLINTANDVAGAWIVDSLFAKTNWVAWSGCLFGICFVTPFFPFSINKGFHFVFALSLYDTMYSFVAILLGSILADNHTMGNAHRVQILAWAKGFNLVLSFAVARIGLSLFASATHTSGMKEFQIFVVLLAMVVSVMFVMAQTLMTASAGNNKSRPNVCGLCQDWFQRCLSFGTSHHSSTETQHLVHPQEQPHRKKRLELRRVVSDFYNHSNFIAWVGMEMLLECQYNFHGAFSKTFVDQLLVQGGHLSQGQGNTLLSSIRPMTQIASILLLIPIRQLGGYKHMYSCMFGFNFICASVVYLFGSTSCMNLMFLTLYPVVTGAVSSAGFALAMSDMVLEQKLAFCKQERQKEASLAGLYMGANALLCKPMDALLPMVASRVLTLTENKNQTLHLLLVGPPMVFSVLQWWSWSRYNLTLQRTKELRNELKQFQKEESLEKDMEL